MGTPARKLHTQQIHQISVTVAYNTAGVTGGLQVGTLPAGAVLDKTIVAVTTAFNAGTTNTLSVGTTATGTQLISATAGGSVARVDTVVPVAQMGPLAADTPIYVSYGTSGTAATTGVATVVVTYVAAVG